MLDDDVTEPTPLPKTRSRPLQGVDTYELQNIPISGPKRNRARKLPPRQNVVAVIGPKVEPGSTYFAFAPEKISVAAFQGITRQLDKFGKEFTPEVNFFLLPFCYQFVDVTPYDARKAAQLLKQEYKVPSAITMKPEFRRLTPEEYLKHASRAA